MRRLAIRIFQFLLIVSAFILCVYGWYLVSCLISATALSDTFSYLSLRFTILSEGESSTSARFHIYDPTGDELAVIERSWNDSDLILDMATAEFDSTTIYIPHTARAKHTAEGRHSALFSQYYDREFMRAGSPELRAIRRFIRYAKRVAPYFPGRFGKIVSIDLGFCKPGIEYTIIGKTDGTLSIE